MELGSLTASQPWAILSNHHAECPWDSCDLGCRGPCGTGSLGRPKTDRAPLMDSGGLTLAQAILVALVSAGVTSLAGYASVRATLRHQRMVERNDELRHLQEAKLERIRAAMIRLVSAARAARSAASEYQVRWEPETEEQRDERVGAYLRRALEDLDSAQVSLMLEEGTAGFITSFEKVWETLIHLKQKVDLARIDPGDAGNYWTETKALLGEIVPEVDRLVEEGKGLVAKLSRPVADA